MGKKNFYNDELDKILLVVDEDKIPELVENWLTRNEIEFQPTSHMQYKILNGCEANIMLYPTTRKLIIQSNGINYVQTARSSTLLAVIKGDIPYKRTEVS